MCRKRNRIYACVGFWICLAVYLATHRTHSWLWCIMIFHMCLCTRYMRSLMRGLEFQINHFDILPVACMWNVCTRLTKQLERINFPFDKIYHQISCWLFFSIFRVHFFYLLHLKWEVKKFSSQEDLVEMNMPDRNGMHWRSWSRLFDNSGGNKVKFYCLREICKQLWISMNNCLYICPWTSYLIQFSTNVAFLICPSIV